MTAKDSHKLWGAEECRHEWNIVTSVVADVRSRTVWDACDPLLGKRVVIIDAWFLICVYALLLKGECSFGWDVDKCYGRNGSIVALCEGGIRFRKPLNNLI